MKDVEVDLLKSNAIEYINCHSRESATFERLFSQIELVKNRLQCVSAQLIRIAIEGPELTDVNFEEILDIFGQKNRHIQSAIDHNYYSQFNPGSTRQIL